MSNFTFDSMLVKSPFSFNKKNTEKSVNEYTDQNSQILSKAEENLLHSSSYESWPLREAAFNGKVKTRMSASQRRKVKIIINSCIESV